MQSYTARMLDLQDKRIIVNACLSAMLSRHPCLNETAKVLRLVEQD